MSYIDSILETGERRTYSAQIHWLANARWHYFMANIFGDLVITDRRIIEKKGVIRIRCRSVSLSQIASVTLQQSFWGRVLGYGNILVRDSGGRGFVYRDISDPQMFVHIVTKSASVARHARHGQGLIGHASQSIGEAVEREREEQVKEINSPQI
jgi:uncharacterized membrane protein YdbT with pleckstrin-like domain